MTCSLPSSLTFHSQKPGKEHASVFIFQSPGPPEGKVRDWSARQVLRAWGWQCRVPGQPEVRAKFGPRTLQRRGMEAHVGVLPVPHVL